MSRDREERRLHKVKVSLMRNPKFAMWSGILMVGTTSVDDNLPTAMTNGRDEVYGREFVKSLNDKELAFVVLHENLHKAFRHLFIWKRLYTENAMLANMACDYVINLYITDMDSSESVATMPKKDGKLYGLRDEKYRGMNTKQVFDLLKQDQQGKGGKGQPQDGEGGDGAGNPGGAPGGFDEHDWEGAKGMTEKEKATLERDIDQAVRQGQMAHQKLHGKGKGGLGRELEDLLSPEVPWQEQLLEYVSSMCPAKDASSWRRVNRRFIGQDIYLPTLIGERIPRLFIGVDTSGSISSELKKFMSEVKFIAEQVKPEFVDLVYWGHEVESFEEYDATTLDNLITSTRPVGGGGTAPQCVVDFIEKQQTDPACVIMFTDGYVPDWGQGWKHPVIWVVVGNRSAMASHGKTIHLNN